MPVGICGANCGGGVWAFGRVSLLEYLSRYFREGGCKPEEGLPGFMKEARKVTPEGRCMCALWGLLFNFN